MAGVLILHHMTLIISLQRSALLEEMKGGVRRGREIKKRRARESKVDTDEGKKREGRWFDDVMFSCG